MQNNENLIVLNQIEQLIKSHQFQHFYLYNNVLKAISNDDEINAKWLIGDNNSWILGFCTNNNYQIYGLNFNNELLESVSNDFDFTTLPNGIFFSGHKDIIEYIIGNNSGVRLEIIKNRYFYEIIPDNFSGSSTTEVNLRFAKLADLEKLAKMYCNFYEEEYNGENNKEILEMKVQIEAWINDQEIIVAVDDDNVLGFCSRMNTHFNIDMIGTIYVSPKYRERNIATSLLSEMTKRILIDFNKTWLMTDMTNAASNNLVKKVGYRQIFEYTSGQIEK